MNLNLQFQIYDWSEDHESNNDSDCEEEYIGNYIIHAFGRCDDGKSVYAKITGYNPAFYILLPNKFQHKQKHNLEEIKVIIENYLKSKDNKKVYYKYKHTLIETQLLKMKNADGFTNDKEFYYIKLIFSNMDGMKKYRSFFENNDLQIPSILELTKPTKFKLYESNLLPMLRCFHIRDISGCSWIETNKYKLITIENNKESRCDIEIIVDWRYLNAIKKDHNAPFKICSFDIECNSMDGDFPQAKRIEDCIIQIGTTYTLIGSSIPYRQYIGCLKQTSLLDNIIVESFETEHELILGFIEEINNSDCDIITGYNIFYFDEKYIMDRCREVLNLENEISFMSKLKNHKCNFKETKLASSALGENLLRFWETPGRVHIDLMKEVQKFANLTCYKLDFVASNYIRDKVETFEILDNENLKLICKSVNDIQINDYIHLSVIKGFISDDIGNKYNVINIDKSNKSIIVKYDENILEDLNKAKLEGEIFWSQAKDDIGPKDIFKLQKGTPDNRATVAKYCVKDCRLVSLLINKLEVVTKNIEMANVCYVPLSYLFIRGQGIKLFSLTLKEFRIQKYLFPVIKLDKLYKCKDCNNEYINFWSCPKCKSKKREEIESENSTYEGAIVFDPVSKVDYEAIATKDFASLYPSTAIEKNMSHETIIENLEYDNLPDIKYYNAEFKESDGSIVYKRFAQINNKLGVIPTILDNLMKERKVIKKLMGNEKDPFKYRILDAKQLAVKVTANSLYGQLGASTSPICKRDIAACITSTGREQLILAKKYDEEFLPWIMNSLKYFYKNNEIDKINKIYDDELKARNDEELISSIKKYVSDIENYTFQPVIRYGDTDSIFSCYRFREKCIKLDDKKSLIIWKKIVGFAKKLIEPFFKEKEKIIFNELFEKYYGDDKIIDLHIPPGPIYKPKPTHYAHILPIEDRLKQFIKEYMEESYIPWLWTITELVEKDYTYMFDIKLTLWAEHQLSKIRLIPENMDENRRHYLLKPIMELITIIFNNKYITPSDKVIKDFSLKLKTFVYKNEITLDDLQLYKLCKILMEKTIKEKWIFSSDRKELIKIMNQFINSTTNVEINNKEIINYYLINFIADNKNIDINTQRDLLIKNLLNDQDMNCDFNEELLNKHTKDFIEKYNKNNGKKSLEEIMEDFLIKDLKISFQLDKNNYNNYVIQFIDTNLKRIDMSDMDKGEVSIYYWLQPRWDFIDNKKVYIIDIYEGGMAITDKRTLEYSMEMGKISGELIKSHLQFPHDCEYEKTYWPWAILSKKKYVGNKYEFNPNKFKQDFMGIVLKRRDNSVIVKKICSGIIDRLINQKDPESAKQFTKQCLQDMFDGKYDIKYFLQSRNIKLKESYKDWTKIAHIYLANKITKRDPGNAPQSGDRIEFAVIKVPIPINGVKLLQGDIIETPEYIKTNKLEINYLFYLTNQIMNPALQFLELVDKNAMNIFTEFIDKYSLPKIKKITKVSALKLLLEKNNINNINTINNKYISDLKDIIKKLNKLDTKKISINQNDINKLNSYFINLKSY